MSHTRRRFLAASAATISAGYFVNPTPAQESKSPNAKLNLAAVGATGRAGDNIDGCQSENIIAIADVDANRLDKGTEKPFTKNAAKFKDFRMMLEKLGDKIDGVLVGTPDHCHAPAAAMALRMKKHVYCEKPLTHTVVEARTLANLAKENKLVTQMGTQIHAGDNYRRVVELVQSGAIGDVKEAHVWSAAQYTGAKFEYGDPVPAGLDWDLWLGPAKERPYSKGVHPFTWRKFWDYGTGGLGDFGCHFMDLTHWALKLRSPTSVEAMGSPVDEVSCPEWTSVKYEFPARDKMPALKLTWYDGGKQPELLKSLKYADGKPLDFNSAQLFIGTQGMIISDYGRHFMLKDNQVVDFKPPEKSIPSSIGHHKEWLEVIRTGSGTTTCNFDYSGSLTETVLLGTVSYRSGKRLEWDAANLKVPNAPEAEKFLHKEYRKGWEL